MQADPHCDMLIEFLIVTDELSSAGGATSRPATISHSENSVEVSLARGGPGHPWYAGS